MLQPLPTLFLLTLLTTTTSYTSLSTGQCPSNFDINSANTTSSSLSAAVDFLYKNLYSSSDQQKLQKAFNEGDTKTVNQQISSISVLVPFALIAFAFIVTYIIALCCCIFEKTCPPCKQWKRDFSRRPYERSELKCAMVFALIFAIGIAITTILGFVFFPALSK